MVDDPHNMFENDADLTNTYDFDLLSRHQKQVFIDVVFSRQGSIGCCVVDHTVITDFLKMLEETYQRKREDIISCLKGKLNFDGFSSYFCSFFSKD